MHNFVSVWQEEGSRQLELETCINFRRIIDQQT